MTKNNLELSAEQYDLLKELFNLGVGGAANSLSQLVDQEVVLSVPSLIFESPVELAERIGSQEHVYSVTQAMEGPFAMHSALLFHPEDSFDVVKAMLDQHLSDETLAELQSEALTEIGNIVLNACISVIAEAIGENFTIHLPEFRDSTVDTLLDETMEEVTDKLLSIIVKMELKNKKLTGHLVFILNTDSISNLHKTLNLMLERYY